MLEMYDTKLTNDKMKTFGDDAKGAFKTAARLEEFGEKQNHANEILAANVNDLIKRVCALEDRNVVYDKRFRKIADELSNIKTELDRIKLSSKLNSNAIDRINKSLAEAMNAASPSAAAPAEAEPQPAPSEASDAEKPVDSAEENA